MSSVWPNTVSRWNMSFTISVAYKVVEPLSSKKTFTSEETRFLGICKPTKAFPVWKIQHLNYAITGLIFPIHIWEPKNQFKNKVGREDLSCQERVHKVLLLQLTFSLIGPLLLLGLSLEMHNSAKAPEKSVLVCLVSQQK